MQKWEYLARAINSYDELAELESIGEDGWELIAVTEDAHRRYTLFFKRPKS